jgi:hypothetical protein
MCTIVVRCKVRLNINTQLNITALKFTEFPDHVSKDNATNASIEYMSELPVET